MTKIEKRLQQMIKDNKEKSKLLEEGRPYQNLVFGRQPPWWQKRIKELLDEELILLRIKQHI